MQRVSEIMVQFWMPSTEDELSLQRSYSSHSIMIPRVDQYSNLLSHDRQNVCYQGPLSSRHSPKLFFLFSFFFLLSHKKSSKLTIKTKTNEYTNTSQKIGRRWGKTLRGSCYKAGSIRKEKHDLWLIWRRLQIALGNNFSTWFPSFYSSLQFLAKGK